MERKLGAALAGLIFGMVAVCLGIYGNPANMALCVACFIRDIAGALGLHRAEAVQYIRPEVVGVVIGAFIIGLIKKEYAPKGGSSPFTRFILGICVMVGALIFLGCPLRMVLRIAGGDLNAVIGLAGFAGGILTGIVFLNRGFSLQRSHDQPPAEGMGLPAVHILLLVLLIAAPAFVFFSKSGPGSVHAPAFLSLAGGLIVGAAAQRSRLCFIAGVRDAVLFKNFHMLLPFAVILATVLAGNVLSEKFAIGFEKQPIAHSAWIWNVAGLYLVGFGSVLLGGCPLRQLVLAGGGNSDAGVTVLGFITGAAICHNFGLASSGAGPTPNGRIAFAACAAILFAIAALSTKRAS
ncbi:MAG: YedE family putative selenium transporter, partial [Synergistaceae bacterium]|nr:YedE family putative selenium transporter [Synergistaceae bacterium]